MSKKLVELVSEKYGIAILEKDQYNAFILAMEYALGVTKETDFKGAMKLLNKMHDTISKVMTVKKEVVDCLTIENINHMIKTCKTYDEFQCVLVDLIKLYNASKKVGAEGTYSLMVTKKWYDEYEYWIFEDDNEEMIEYLNMYKSIKPYGMFKYASSIDIEI